MTTHVSSRCPEPEVLAAFVAGELSGAELEMVTTHLLECPDCRFIVGEVARVNRENVVTFQRPGIRRYWPWWLGAAAAAVIGIGSLTLWHERQSSGGGPIQLLVDATPRAGRYIEPRLSGGFPWAPLRPISRDQNAPPDPQQMELTGVAGKVLRLTANDHSVQAQHAAALAQLVSGDSARATETLNQLAPAASDAHVWSDLAAARYTKSVRTDDPELLAEALAAADKAISLDGRLPEALFNRALIVEGLGLREQARVAWEQYLTVDRQSDWAREAERHLHAPTPVLQFKEELPRQYDAIAAAKMTVVQEFVERFPQEVRTWGETEILARWADALMHHDPAAAAKHLQVARVLGRELGHWRGEEMLNAAVKAIDDAGDPETLAKAHLQFRAAQRVYRSQRPAVAEGMFLAAATGFEKGGSPVSLLARYFAANTAYDQGRREEAGNQLNQLLLAAPPQFIAHRAQVEWELGLVRAAQNDWGGALDVLTDSIRLFESLGERNLATSVREILSEVYDRIGDSRQAWRYRLPAMQELGRVGDSRIQEALDAAARAASLAQNWSVCLSLLGLELEMADRTADDLLYVETLLLRATVEEKMARHDAAQGDLRRARVIAPRMSDAAFHEQAEADRIAVEAMLSGSPADSVELLGRAIEFHRSRGRHMHLPALFLHRGKALLALSNPVAAATDFESGIAVLEKQWQSLARGQMRWGVFTTAQELFEEAMALSLARGDVRTAFAYAERARARELLEELGTSHRSGHRPAEGMAPLIVEYAALPSRLVIFVADRGRVSAVQQEVAREALTRAVDLLTQGALTNDNAKFRRAAAVLYGFLIAPVGDQIVAGRELVFVPDATLRAVPFSALVDPTGRFLIETNALVVAPSAAVFLRLTASSPPRDQKSHLLIISGPVAVGGDPGQLSNAKRESDAVAESYSDVSRVLARDARPDELAAQAARADVIHFVGHAGSGDSGAALLTSPRAGGEGQLDVRTIAALHLPRTRVVVLAACSTARGEERGEEGSISVARAFLAAGVPSVVATLWPIDDTQAADFFPRLHQQLARGVSPAQALRAAQLESIRGHSLPPAIWAAVQVIGS